MNPQHHEPYREGEPYELVIFDVRDPEVDQRLHRERAAWAEHGYIEGLDRYRFVLVIRPGGARRL